MSFSIPILKVIQIEDIQVKIWIYFTRFTGVAYKLRLE